MGDDSKKNPQWVEHGLRIKALRQAKGMTQGELQAIIRPDSSGHQTIQKIEKGEQSIGRDAVRLAQALDVTPEYLVSAPPRVRQVPLFGDVGVGGEYAWHAGSGRWMEIKKVDAPVGDMEVTGSVRVVGDSLQAAGYWDGDLLFFKFKGDPIEEVIGKRVIVQERGGGAFLGVLKDGARQGRYLFKSLVGDTPVREVAVEWAARIRWHQQG